jgi:hypothetical protein
VKKTTVITAKRLLVLIFALPSGVTTAEPPAMNIVLFLVDDVGAQMMEPNPDYDPDVEQPKQPESETRICNG